MEPNWVGVEISRVSLTRTQVCAHADCQQNLTSGRWARVQPDSQYCQDVKEGKETDLAEITSAVDVALNI